MKFKLSTIQHALFAVILILAAALRFYHFSDIPFTNDELSALHRLRFSSLSELIQQGINPDGHPALIQLFLYYYTRLFGTVEWVVKLPFAICGVLAVAVVYRIGSFFNNRSLGLLVASAMATSPFFVSYSQIARPYTPGLLFVLLFVLSGLHIVLLRKQTKWIYTLHGLFLLLSTLTHYFSFLSAGIAAMLLMIGAERNIRKHLLMIYAATFVLYSPHIPIFIHQLQTGGVGGTHGWLAAPDWYFLPRFLWYSTGYSWMVALMYFLLLAATLYQLFKAPHTPFKLQLFGLILFFGSYFIGFAYSILRNPVLQYSVLLFVTPFLLLFVCYGVSQWRQRIVLPIMLMMIATNMHALIHTRNHYSLFYHHGYQALATCLKGQAAPCLLTGNDSSYFQYYFQKLGIQPTVINYHSDTLSDAAILKQISGLQTDTLIIGFAIPGSPQVFALAASRYQHEEILDAGPGWECRRYTVRRKSYTSIKMNESMNTGDAFGISSESEDQGHPTIRDVTASVVVSSSAVHSSAQLVLQVNNTHGKQLGWYSRRVKDFIHPEDSVLQVVLSIRLSDVVGTTPSVLKAYLWNPASDGNFRYQRPQIRVSKGNQLIYSLIDPVVENIEK